MQRVIGRRWSRWIFGIAIVLSCTGMAVTSLPSKSVVLRPEIDLLLDDISDEPTPDNISSLITKARATRSRADAWGLDGSLDENNLAPNEVAHVARYLRSQYPFESLTQRLAYERDAEHKRSRLSDNAIAWLNELESDPAPDPYVKSFASDFATERAYALKQLHSDEVVAFVNREGEGMARMPTYGVEFVVLPDAPAIPVAVDAATANHSLERLGTESQFHDYRINRQQTKRSPIFELHATYREDFAATRNGLIVDADQVAGFAPHAITRREDIFSPDPIGGIAETRMTSLNSDTPSIAETHPDPLWRVTNLLLVSLLKFDQPHVYLSEFMPAMTELPDLEMRDLTPFENLALKRLYAGEDIVSETEDGKIRMLGSLRASKDCLACHSVDRGELLGAFSYELVRVGTPSDSDNKESLQRGE